MKQEEQTSWERGPSTFAGDHHDDLPQLLTQEEAIRLLRLDKLGLKDPKESLRHLRRTRQIGYTKVAGKVLIPRKEIIMYLKKQTVEVRN